MSYFSQDVGATTSQTAIDSTRTGEGSSVYIERNVFNDGTLHGIGKLLFFPDAYCGHLWCIDFTIRTIPSSTWETNNAM